MIADLLDATHIEARRLRVSPVAVNLRTLANEVVGRARQASAFTATVTGATSADVPALTL